MNILIIGSGGREHALAWKAAQSSQVKQVYVAPGNAGTALENKVKNIAINVTDISALIDFAKTHSIYLTIVGPETPLALGIVDAFQNEKLPCFGPSQAAAKLEASKEFAKDFMTTYEIPTANYQVFSDISLAKAYIKTQSLPIVIKADGLAAGKGVIIAKTLIEAEQTIEAILSENQFGDAGHRIVIEEFLQGEEASFIVISDGQHVIPLVSSQDHKARDNGDQGPNTGGMGAYSPAPVVTDAVQTKVMQQVIYPVIKAMAEAGTPYVGFLYAGLMINTKGEIKVLEFNCRLGDPEAEVLLMRLQSDLIALCQAALQQKLSVFQIEWDPRPALGVVLASAGYPDQYEKGFSITGYENILPNCKVFHCGTALENNQVLNTGGRVLCVCAIADDLAKSQKLAYDQVKKIHWQGMFYRTDIGYRGITSENSLQVN